MGKKELQKKKYKWSFAIGTTSRVPNKKGQHYLMLDIDNQSHHHLDSLLHDVTNWFHKFAFQPTKHGLHIFTNQIGTFNQTAKRALSWGADPSWIKIARKRGYFFLADKNIVQLDWPVERMILHAKGKRKKSDTAKA